MVVRGVSVLIASARPVRTKGLELSRRPRHLEQTHTIQNRIVQRPMSKDKLKRVKHSTIFAKKDLVADKWVSQSEAARIRDVSPQAIGRLVNKGRFRTLRIGGRVLLDRSEVENYKPRRKGRPRK